MLSDDSSGGLMSTTAFSRPTTFGRQELKKKGSLITRGLKDANPLSLDDDNDILKNSVNCASYARRGFFCTSNPTRGGVTNHHIRRCQLSCHVLTMYGHGGMIPRLFTQRCSGRTWLSVLIIVFFAALLQTYFHLLLFLYTFL